MDFKTNQQTKQSEKRFRILKNIIMSKILMIKTLSGLKPVYSSDLEVYQKIALNEEFYIEYTKKRNYNFHKKFFSLIKLAYDNQSDYTSMERMRKKLIEVAGYYDEYRDPITKEITKEVNSISFAKMDNFEFETLYNSVKHVIVQWIGVSNEEIEENIAQYY